MYNQYQNNNVCDLDSISVHDMEFDLNNSNGSYGQFTYGDYLQELQELEQGRTPMKIDRQAQIPRDLTNLHWLHNVGVPIEQNGPPRNGTQQTITLMVDPNTNMPVQFTTGNRATIQTLPPQGITYMAMPQTQVTQLQHPTSTIYTRHDLHHQQNLIHHHQQQHKYSNDKGKENGNPGHKVFPKPVFSYSCLIAMALRNSDQGSLPVSEIYKYMQ